MKKFSHILFGVFIIFLIFSLVACNGGEPLDYGSNNVIPPFDETQKSDESTNDQEETTLIEKDNSILLNEIKSPVSQTKAIVSQYMASAKSAYKTADYTSSIIANYITAASDFNDRPLPITLSFSGVDGANSYILELSRNAEFTADVRRIALEKDVTQANVSNLYTGTTYFWRVTAVMMAGENVVSEISSFTTAKDEVRWIDVEGVRNVRDIGGWTGLNQGMVYRGSEMNLVGTHGLQITDKGRQVMIEELCVKTDLDFRAASENGSLTSPIGAEVRWCNQPIGNFLSAFGDSYRSVLKQFADPNNYPIYMHCWGGADRTGTVALILEGLCGVSEEDLSIDLELTSFSSFGYRYRYDNGSYLFASTINKIKADYEGDTLKEKFEAYALDIGLTRAEISNIQSLLSGNGATFDRDSLNTVFFDPDAQNITIGLLLANGQTVSSVKLNGISVPFTLENGVLILSAQVPTSVGALEGKLTVTFSDGQTLITDYTATPIPTLAQKIVGGDLKSLFNDGIATYENGTVKKASGELVFTHDALKSLFDAGYTSVSFHASAELTGSVSATDLRIRMVARWRSGSSYLATDKQDLTSISYPATVEGIITIDLTESNLGTDNVFALVPQSGGNIILRDISFS